MIIASAIRALALAHFTLLEVSPLELIDLQARIGDASVGLRLHPGFPERSPTRFRWGDRSCGRSADE